MSFSFSGFVRLFVLLAIGTTMLAVGVARLDTPKPVWRTLRPVNHVNVNEYFLPGQDRIPHWLDVETGGISAYPLADGNVLEAATSSPWVDQRGRRQVAGRWSSRITDGPMSVIGEFGLARYSFPDGEILDQVPTEVVPVAPPCWFPGIRARILFTAGDGRLYRFAFEPEARPRDPVGPEFQGDSKPRPLFWRCGQPGLGDVFLGDLSWPEEPRLGGCVLATMRLQERGVDGSLCFSRTQLWWLKLNHAGTEIVEVGRLLIPDSLGDRSHEDDARSPTIAAGPDGRLLVAYLGQAEGDLGWKLHLAPIRSEGEGHAPVARESESRVLAERCQPAHPAFSADGRWLNVFVGLAHTAARFTRIAVAEGLRADSRP